MITFFRQIQKKGFWAIAYGGGEPGSSMQLEEILSGAGDVFLASVAKQQDMRILIKQIPRGFEFPGASVSFDPTIKNGENVTHLLQFYNGKTILPNILYMLMFKSEKWSWYCWLLGIQDNRFLIMSALPPAMTITAANRHEFFRMMGTIYEHIRKTFKY